MHVKIARVLGSKISSSLLKIEVPIDENGKITGWKIPCTANKVHDTIIEKKHATSRTGKFKSVWKWFRVLTSTWGNLSGSHGANK